MKNLFKKISLLVLALSLLVVAPLETSAASKTVKALQCLGVFSENPATSRTHKLSEIPSIKSGYTVKVTSDDYGFVKYKAPKSGKYKVTIKNYKASDSSESILFGLSTNDFDDIKVSGLNNDRGYFYLYTKEEYNKVKNNFGSLESFKNSVKRSNDSDYYYDTKSFTVKLSKGDYLYLQTKVSGTTKNKTTGSYVVSIKKL